MSTPSFYNEIRSLVKEVLNQGIEFYKVYRDHIYQLVINHPLKTLVLEICIFVFSMFSWILFFSFSFLPFSAMISWPFRYCFVVFPVAYGHVLFFPSFEDEDKNNLKKNWQGELDAIKEIFAKVTSICSLFNNEETLESKTIKSED